MKIALFCQSIISDYNLDAIPFLRGVITELQSRGHETQVFETRDNVAYLSALKECGKTAISEFKRYYPDIITSFYQSSVAEIAEIVRDVDLVLVHSSADTDTIKLLAEIKKKFSYALVFYDTSNAVRLQNNEVVQELENYNLILASSSSLARVYKTLNINNNIFVWHLGADTKIYQPRFGKKDTEVVLFANITEETDLAAVEEFFIEPVRYLRVKAKIFGCKAGKPLKQLIAKSAIKHEGWVPSFKTPLLYPNYITSIYLPALNDAPSAHLFHALACGSPLLSAVWEDNDALFNKGREFLWAKDGYEMKHYILEMMNSTLKEVIVSHGIRSINNRHSCKHRVNELEKILVETDVIKERIQAF